MEAKTDAEKPGPKPAVKTEPEDDPFAPTPKPVAKTESKPESKTESEPDVPAPPAKTAKTEPEPKVESKPEAKTEAEPALGPRQAPSFDLAAFEKAVKAADSAYADDLTPEVYEKLCQMAEATTFTKPAGADAAKVDAQKQAIRDLVQRIGKSKQGPEKVAGSAKKLIEDVASKGGILLSGTILKTAAKGGLNAAGVKLDADSGPVTVFSMQPLGAEADKVMILGVIVREPGKNLAGYSGKQPMVIWAGMPVKLP
jgi:hypothetical protein